MRSNSCIAGSIFLSCSLLSTSAFAWDGFGHMEVAAVAWELMTDSAKSQAIQLLTTNPRYKTWINGVAADKKDKYAFMLAATWPDYIKSAKGYQSDGPNNGDTPPPGPQASQNIGYADKLRHKYWHFIDEPFPGDGSQTTAPAEPNALTQIAAFRKTLPPNSGAKKTVRSYDLVWLLHLVGDVHQPLHATSRFLNDKPDNGGNAVTINCDAGVSCEGARELHAFWDDLLGPNTARSAVVEAAAGELPAADASLASIDDENMWIDESFKAAQSVVYKSPVDVGLGPFTLTAAYKANAVDLAKKRVALAGARLANLLNAAFK
jgi:S1/P1 Nuclease